MALRSIAAFFVFVLSSCSTECDQLIARLTQEDLNYYFTSSYGFDLMDSLNGDSHSRELLAEIALDTQSHSGASFIACEILLHDTTRQFYKEGDKPLLEDLYVRALSQKQFSGSTENMWAIPCLFEDSTFVVQHLIAPAGKHLLQFQSSAGKNLRSLLADSTCLFITGPGDRRTQLVNERQYRVKDIAAFFICQMRGWEFKGCLGPTERDVEIEAIKQKLK